jgi:hypothetical protein
MSALLVADGAFPANGKRDMDILRPSEALRNKENANSIRCSFNIDRQIILARIRAPRARSPTEASNLVQVQSHRVISDCRWLKHVKPIPTSPASTIELLPSDLPLIGDGKRIIWRGVVVPLVAEIVRQGVVVRAHAITNRTKGEPDSKKKTCDNEERDEEYGRQLCSGDHSTVLRAAPQSGSPQPVHTSIFPGFRGKPRSRC